MSVIGWGGLSAEGGPLRSATNCGTDEVGKYGLRDSIDFDFPYFGELRIMQPLKN